MQHTKRKIIKGATALLALTSLPLKLLAAAWPQKTFSATAAGDAMVAYLGTEATTPSDHIDLKLPQIAENGAVVPIVIETTLKNVESIGIVVRDNPRPMAATFEIPTGTLPKIATRIKMGQTSEVVALVKTSNGIYSATREVKVTIGGCGG